MLSVLNNIQFYADIRKFHPKSHYFCFLSYWNNFIGTQKQVRINEVNETLVFQLLRFDCVNIHVEPSATGGGEEKRMRDK